VLRDTRTGTADAVHLELLGRANASNALAAASLALSSGLAFDAVVAGLSSGVVVPGRLERIDAGQPFTVLVDYAHTPDALAAALDAARAVAGTARVIVAFGCGGDRDRAKRPLMGQVAARGADVVVLTSDNPRSESPDAIAADVLEGLRAGPARVLVELDRKAAIGAAFAAAAAGDVVVLAGKGHETAQTGGGATVAFDDRLVARDELGARRWS
jgi:UDP-N-acetylmuramoyl-L-alanyl-D-glutamate--2,6-diaminopimelate ligase